jgi:hypothetical protein
VTEKTINVVVSLSQESVDAVAMSVAATIAKEIVVTLSAETTTRIVDLVRAAS